MNKSEFFETSWCRFKYDAKLAHWTSTALPYARKAIAARENSQWLRCGDTWHAGINALIDQRIPGFTVKAYYSRRGFDACRQVGWFRVGQRMNTDQVISANRGEC